MPFPWQDPSSYPSVLEPVLSNTNLALKCSPHTLGQPFLIIRSPSLLLCSFLCLSQSHLEIHTPYWGLPHTKDLTLPSTCEDNHHTDPVQCTPGRTRHNLQFPIYLSRCPYIFPQGLSHYLQTSCQLFSGPDTSVPHRLNGHKSSYHIGIFSILQCQLGICYVQVSILPSI